MDLLLIVAQAALQASVGYAVHLGLSYWRRRRCVRRIVRRERRVSV
jgi:hypothetical protein